MTSEKFEVRPFTRADMLYFREMFCTYFKSDLKIDITTNDAETVCLEIADSMISGITALEMLLIEEKLVGFIIYQIDSPNSDWCEREGWGFIREIYIDSSMRRKGFGSKLVAHAEKKLYSKGVKNIYLTSDEANEFWRLCGYKSTEKVSNTNNVTIYEK